MFMLHILLVNIVLGSSLYMLFRRFRGAPENQHGVLGDMESLRHKIPTIMAFAINLGIPALLFLQIVWGQFFYTSSILMAVPWILVIPVVLLVYYGLYRYAYIGDDDRSSGIILAVVCLGLLTVSFVFLNNMTLMLHPERWAGYFQQRGGTLLNLSDKTFIPRWLHVICASVAVSGLVMGLVAWLRSGKDGAGSIEIKKGLEIYAFATIVQAGIGLWHLLVLPGDFISGFTGNYPVYTAAFFAGILFASVSVLSAFAKKFVLTAGLFLLTMICMVITRNNLRTLYLKPYFSPESLPVVPQYGLLLVFILVLGAGLAAIVWMIRYSMTENDGGTE